MGVVAKILWRNKMPRIIRWDLNFLAWLGVDRLINRMTLPMDAQWKSTRSKNKISRNEAAVRPKHFKNEVTDHFYQDQSLFLIALRLVKTNDDRLPFFTGRLAINRWGCHPAHITSKWETRHAVRQSRNTRSQISFAIVTSKVDSLSRRFSWNGW